MGNNNNNWERQLFKLKLTFLKEIFKIRHLKIFKRNKFKTNKNK
jgi:hypothetical protein